VSRLWAIVKESDDFAVLRIVLTGVGNDAPPDPAAHHEGLPVT
jgi:hypothetical protein